METFPQLLRELQADSSPVRVSLDKGAASSKDKPCPEGSLYLKIKCRTSQKNIATSTFPMGLAEVSVVFVSKFKVFLISILSLSLSQDVVFKSTLE